MLTIINKQIKQPFLNIKMMAYRPYVAVSCVNTKHIAQGTQGKHDSPSGYLSVHIFHIKSGSSLADDSDLSAEIR